MAVGPLQKNVKKYIFPYVKYGILYKILNRRTNLQCVLQEQLSHHEGSNRNVRVAHPAIQNYSTAPPPPSNWRGKVLEG
jgi:hypothetical protein